MLRLPDVTLCLIVKNEAENIPRVLEHAKTFPHTLVVDTGSTDDTRLVAARLGATVAQFDWCDNFAAARNVWLSQVSRGWIFWLDADDEIDESTALEVLDLAANAPDDVLGYVFNYRYPNGYVCDHIRLYRADRGIRWNGRVHEHLDFRDSGTGRLLSSNLEVRHVGFPQYDPEALEARSRRNNRLLELELADDPNRAIVIQYIAMDHQAHGRHKAALKWFERALRHADPAKDFTWLPDMYVNMARSYTRSGKPWKAKQILNEGMRVFPKIMPIFIQRHLDLKTPDGRTAEDIGRSRRELLRGLS